MSKYTTVKIPEGLLEKIKQYIEQDSSFLNASDFIRHAIRKMLIKE